jgi:hypothetical protein
MTFDHHELLDVMQRTISVLFLVCSVLLRDEAHGRQYTLPQVFDTVRVSELTLDDVPVTEALRALKKRIRDDNGWAMAVSVVFFRPQPTPKEDRMTLMLKEVSGRTAFDRVCAAAKMSYWLDDFAVIVFPKESEASIVKRCKELSQVANQMEHGWGITVPVMEFTEMDHTRAFALLRRETERVNVTGKPFVVRLDTISGPKRHTVNAWLFNQPVAKGVTYLCLAAELDVALEKDGSCVVRDRP